MGKFPYNASFRNVNKEGESMRKVRETEAKYEKPMKKLVQCFGRWFLP